MAKYPIPKWKPTRDGYVCSSERMMMAAFATEAHAGFSLPEFDLWLASVPDGYGIKRELSERRELALDSIFDNQHEAGFRHLEWMMLRRRMYMAADRHSLVRRAVETLADSRRKGGAQSAAARREESLKRAEEARKIFDSLRMPERNRASIIATRMNLSPKQFEGCSRKRTDSKHRFLCITNIAIA